MPAAEGRYVFPQGNIVPDDTKPRPYKPLRKGGTHQGEPDQSNGFAHATLLKPVREIA